MPVSTSSPTKRTSTYSSSPLCSSSSGTFQVVLNAVEFNTEIVMTIGGELGAKGNIQGASKVLQQILMFHITKSIVYRCINFLFPVFHEGNKPLSKIADKPV